ncbi:MAG: hypothetical protein JSR39_11210, partial [Verrucomicrobia bacterium]|nr:hypothetical protein [Verrucomicrobiota bacterium]
IQQMQHLLSSGASSEDIQQLLPIIQKSQANEELRRAGGGGSSFDQLGRRIQPAAQASVEGVEPAVIDRRQSPKYLMESTPDEITGMAADLARQFPTLYGMDPDKALAEASRRDKARVANDQAYEQRQTLVRNRFDEILKQKIQKEGEETFSDVIGDLQNEFVKKANDDVDAGRLNPVQAANKYGQQALEFAKSRNNLKTIGNESWFTRTPGNTRKSIDKIRESYKELGVLDEFARDLEAFHGLTPYYADYLAFPVKDNKQLNNALSSIKHLDTEQIRKGTALSEAEIAQKIFKDIGENDSLRSIALALHGKGYNEAKFLDEIYKGYNEGKIRLNKRQGRELENRTRVNPNLSDLYIFSFSGLDKLVGIQ